MIYTMIETAVVESIFRLQRISMREENLREKGGRKTTTGVCGGNSENTNFTSSSVEYAAFAGASQN